MATKVKPARPDAQLNQRLADSGLRLTPQRQLVFNALVEDLDHPTADQIFMHTKRALPEISMATIYNCLDALVQCGLVRQVTLDRGATRFCPNMRDHCHFYCEECGGVFDIDLDGDGRPAGAHLPHGFRALHVEATIHGLCSDCAKKKH